MHHVCAIGAPMFVFGTRPEAIKLCPVFLELQRLGVPYLALHSGQHADLVDPVLRYFGCRCDHRLSLMQPAQSPLAFIRALLAAMPALLTQYTPRLVIVHGDTATAYAAMLSAYLSGIPVAHIEAGLRTGDVHAPFPEEYFRRAIDAAADYFYAPTRRAYDTLLREGRPAERILHVGNTATDAIRLCLDQPPVHLADALRGIQDLQGEPLSLALPPSPRLVLLTLHRRELETSAMHALLQAIADAVTALPDTLLLFPVHPSPRVRQCAVRALSNRWRVRLCEPLPLPCMQRLLSLATLLLTDSGGLQEEAAYLGIPTLVLREATERPEGEAAGVLRTVGCAPEAVAAHVRRLLCDESARLTMAHPTDVFGDGHTAPRIASHLQQLCSS